MLVTVWQPKRAAAATSTAGSNAGTTDELLCAIGYDVDTDTNFLDVYDGAGDIHFSQDHWDAHPVRSPDGTHLLAVTPVHDPAGPHVNVSWIDLATGTSVSAAGKACPGGQELSYVFSVAISPDGTEAAVLHQPAWLTNPRTVTKAAGNRTDSFVIGDPRGTRVLERFDLTSMRSLGLVEVTPGLSHPPVGEVRYAAPGRLFVATREPAAGKGQPGTCEVHLYDNELRSPVTVSEEFGSSLAGQGEATVATSDPNIVAQLTTDATLLYVDLTTGQSVAEVPLLQRQQPMPARPVPSILLPAGNGRHLFARAGVGMALVDTDGRNVVARAALPAGRPGNDRSPLSEQFAAVDPNRGVAYVADGRAGQGGIWVYDLHTLTLTDRWISNNRCEGVYLNPVDGSVRTTPLGSSLTLILDANGRAARTVDRRPVTIDIL